MKETREETEEVSSPCVKKCSLDQNRVCPACGRSVEEIALWRDADNELKRKIVEAAKRRRRRDDWGGRDTMTDLQKNIAAAGA